jgi:hypothetical protein
MVLTIIMVYGMVDFSIEFIYLLIVPNLWVIIESITGF